MLNWINSKIEKEVELAQPARSVWEKIFRFSFYYVGAVGLLASFLSLFAPEEYWAKKFGIISWILGVSFGLCVLYSLNYIAARFVKNRGVKVAWFGSMIVVVALIVVGLLRKTN